MRKGRLNITLTSFKLLSILSKRTALAIRRTLGSKAENEPTNCRLECVQALSGSVLPLAENVGGNLVFVSSN